MTDTVGSRLVEARKRLGLTQEALSERTGLPLSTLKKYEGSHREPCAEALAQITWAGINANWLLTGKGPMLLDDLSKPAYRAEEAPADYAAIPLYDVRAAEVGGAVVDSKQVVDFLRFKQEWIRAELRASPDDLYIIYVDGESMEPTLRPGDIILVDHRDQSQARDGIYVMRMDGTLLVKRLQKMPGGVIKVTSDNPAYDSFNISHDQIGADFAIIGRVVWSGRRM